MARFSILGSLAVVLLMFSTVQSRDAAQFRPVGQSSVMCKVCGIFLEVVNDVLNDENVEQWLTQWVEQNVCTRFPEETKEQCIEKAPTFVPALIHWVETLATGSMCSAMQVCGKEGLPSFPVVLDQDETMQCEACKNLTALVQAQVGKIQPESLAEAIQQLEQDCDQLQGEDMQEQCRDFVNKYGYLLVSLVQQLKDTDLSKVCSNFGVCPKTSPDPVVDPIPAELVSRMVTYSTKVSDDEDNCQKCQDVAQAVLDDFVNPEVQEDVAAYLSRACSWVPVIEGQCLDAVGNFTVMAMNTVASDITAEVACDEMNFCSDTPSAVANRENYAEGALRSAVIVY